MKICEELRLEWDEIADKPASQAVQEKKQQDSALDIDALVRRVQLLQVSPNQIEQVKKALESISSVIREKQATGKRDLSLEDKMKLLTNDMELSIELIKQFFVGEPIKRDVFIDICFKLKLEWQKILDIDFLKVLALMVPQVRSLRYKKVQDQCGTLRLLDVARPIELDDLYVDVNILDKPISYARLELSDLPPVYNPKTDEVDRWGLGKIREPRVPGLQAVAKCSKLMVLGKPGAGKSTFLQHIAIQCNRGEFLADQVPIFIRLKSFAEDARKTGDFSLLHYISQEFQSCGVAEQSVIEKVLKYGKALILLDGFDEVPEEDSNEIFREICSLYQNFSKNQVIITCRIATHQYMFQGFTDVEVADFNSGQIEKFAKNWFVTVDKNSEEEGKEKAIQFIEKLNRRENEQIHEIAVTPILLILTCLVFQAKAQFPSKGSKLYEQGLDILLRKWDESRGIKRDEVYRYLFLEQKIELLSQVAAITFEKSRYFFEKGEVEQCISDYLRTLPNAQTDRATLQRDSRAILKSIEAQHGLLVERARGIYSFSHLTFQEYFTALAVINSFNPQNSEKLFSHFIRKSWREVFLLAVDMMRPADELMLLMKKRIDELVASDKELQQFLVWVNSKALSVENCYKLVTVRAFYFDISLVFSPNRTIQRDRELYLDLNRKFADNNDPNELTFDRNLARILSVALNHPPDYSFTLAILDDIAVCIDIANKLKKLNCMRESLQRLSDQLPNKRNHYKKMYKWWKDHGRTWTENLKTLIIKPRNIGKDWHFNEHQTRLLQQYYNTTQFFVDCLNNHCEVSPQVRQAIEDTLLLPISEIEKRQQQIL
ncbi:hypothetical protein NIES4073_24880 [Kalymmatonema gypsitolerans NIES-4073]|nr:hypothetical protein NIES4073_24880 [Scytonema sp. NIES-4073]